MFERFRSQFAQFGDGYLYFGTLAELYIDCGQVENAATAWRDAKAQAMEVGNTQYASHSSSQEAKLRVQLGRAKLSANALREALEKENDPVRRANLLIPLFGLLLTKRSKKLAKSIFEEAHRICNQHKLHDLQVELCLMIGDHNLKGNYKMKLNAMKGYAFAMLSASQSGISKVGAVSSHIVFTMASPNSTVKESEVAPLIDDLRSYLTSAQPHSQRTINFLLWPFFLVRKLFPYRNRPERFFEAVESLVSSRSIDSYLKFGRLRRPAAA